MSHFYVAAALTLAVLVGPAALAQTVQPLESWSQAIRFAPARYQQVLNDKAILDFETQLVWQAAPTTDTMTWADAIDYCYNRNTGGRKGWRLPRIEELASHLVADPNVEGTDGELQERHLFHGVATTLKLFYWSKTPAPTDDTRAYAQDFGTGLIAQGQVEKRDRTEQLHVWCVRGGQG